MADLCTGNCRACQQCLFAQRLKDKAGAITVSRPRTAGASRSSSYWSLHSDAESAAGAELYTPRGLAASKSLAECRSAAEVKATLAVLECPRKSQWVLQQSIRQIE